MPAVAAICIGSIAFISLVWFITVWDFRTKDKMK